MASRKPSDYKSRITDAKQSSRKDITALQAKLAKVHVYACTYTYIFGSSSTKKTPQTLPYTIHSASHTLASMYNTVRVIRRGRVHMVLFLGWGRGLKYI